MIGRTFVRCYLLFLIGSDAFLSGCDMMGQPLRQDCLMGSSEFNMTERCAHGTACNGLGCNYCRKGVEFDGHVGSRHVSWRCVAHNFTYGCMEGSPIVRLEENIIRACCRLWSTHQMPRRCCGECRRRGHYEHTRLELTAQTFVQLQHTMLGSSSSACFGQWRRNVYYFHWCSHCMAQLRAVFLQGGLDMSMESRAGPDPYGRPRLPRRRPGNAPDGEIEVRPPLPRGRTS